jgi:Undecaprenyl-phosphate galactose phosphotransferase WbaP
MSERSASAAGSKDAASQSIKLARCFRRVVCAGGLLLADVATFATAALAFRFGHQVPAIAFYRSLLPVELVVDLFYVFAAAFVLVRYVAGDYSKRQLFWDGTRQTTVGLLIASIPCFLLRFVSPAHYSILPDVFSWFFAIVAMPFYRQAMRYLLSKIGVWQLPTALIGDGPNATDVFCTFRKSLSLGFDVRFQIGFGDSQEYTNAFTGVTRIGLRNPANIVRRLSEAGCLEAVVVTDRLQDEETNELIERLMAAGIEVAVTPQLRRLPMLGMTVNYFFGQDIILLHVRNNMARLPGRVIKRLIDFFGSLVLLVLISPLLVGVAVAIKREGGKVFFVQGRVGKNGTEFPCIKFRTMRADAEEMLQRWKQQDSPLYREYVASNFKLRDDPRVTKVGRCLRRTSLDELPQLANVLMGDMSLVGPRPLLTREIGDYGVTFKLYRQLRPGMTGLWQISGRSHTTFADRAASDEWYVKNWSLWYDIVILLKTVDVLLRKDGAY